MSVCAYLMATSSISKISVALGPMSAPAPRSAFARLEGIVPAPESAHAIKAAVDARTDTHQETGFTLGGSWWDRSRRRPLFA